MTNEENDGFKMVAFMAHLSIMIEKLDRLKGLNVYEGKIKMRANALLTELERYDKVMTRESMKRDLDGTHNEAQMQYAGVRDSLDNICQVWERFIGLPENAQIECDKKMNEIVELINSYSDGKSK